MSRSLLLTALVLPFPAHAVEGLGPIQLIVFRTKASGIMRRRSADPALKVDRVEISAQ
jgi:hypothetical protein